MAKEMRYLEPGKFVTIDDPSWENIKSRLGMIGQGIGVCHLTIPRGTLSIGDTDNLERVTVTYSDDTRKYWSQRILPDNYQTGRLLDITYANSEATVTRNIEGMHETELLYRTVAKDVAVEVAEHFWKTGTLPDGLDWDGTMGKSEATQ